MQSDRPVQEARSWPAEDDRSQEDSAPAPWTFAASAVLMAGLLALSAALL